jgi:hypothetical protein
VAHQCTGEKPGKGSIMSALTKEERVTRYEEKQERRRERLEDRAAKARAESSAQYERASAIGSAIPMGQPILVGHHSERRHRRDISRIDRAMSRSIEADAKAQRLEARAARVGRGGVSSDDPAAADKLRAKLQKLESDRDECKAANRALAAAHRRAKKRLGRDVDGAEELRELVDGLELPQRMRDALFSNAACFGVYSYKFSKFSYQLTNAGAEIRRLKKRIEALDALEALPEREVLEGPGWRLEEDKDDNRLRLYFDGKPPQHERRALKRLGFRWAPSVGAWQRQISERATWSAHSFLRDFRGAEL